MRRYSYIAVAFIILIFGIIVVPRIVTRIQEADRVDATRLSAEMPLAFIELNGEAKRVFTNQDNRLISNEDFLGKV